MHVCMYVLFLKVYLLLHTFHSLFSTENRLLPTPWIEHNAIKMVYGDNFTRIVGCQWHFKSNVT